MRNVNVLCVIFTGGTPMYFRRSRVEVKSLQLLSKKLPMELCSMYNNDSSQLHLSSLLFQNGK